MTVPRVAKQLLPIRACERDIEKPGTFAWRGLVHRPMLPKQVERQHPTARNRASPAASCEAWWPTCTGPSFASTAGVSVAAEGS